MTGVIKSTDAGALSSQVRAFLLAEPPAPIPPVRQDQVIPVEVLTLRREIEALATRVELGDAEIDRLKTDVGRAFREGEAEGRKTGLKEAEDHRAEAMAKLEQGIAAALEEYSRAMSSLERLAALLAREALGKVLGDAETYVPIVQQIIRSHLELLESQSVIRVEVSKSDFAGQQDMAELAAALGRPGLDLRACDELQAGDCRIKLSLGVLEVGVDQQWSRLSAVLEDLAVPGVST